MFEFVIVFALGIAALLAVQSMDVECENPRVPARRNAVKHAAPPLHGARVMQ